MIVALVVLLVLAVAQAFGERWVRGIQTRKLVEDMAAERTRHIEALEAERARRVEAVETCGAETLRAREEADRAAALRAEAEAARDVALAEAAKAKEGLLRFQTHVIPLLVEERDRWHTIACEDAAGYGVAQNMMMQELERMSHACNRPIPRRVAALQQVIEERVPVRDTERLPIEDYTKGQVTTLPEQKGKGWSGSGPAAQPRAAESKA